jgi:hypothetical protein
MKRFELTIRIPEGQNVDPEVLRFAGMIAATLHELGQDSKHDRAELELTSGAMHLHLFARMMGNQARSVTKGMTMAAVMSPKDDPHVWTVQFVRIALHGFNNPE